MAKRAKCTIVTAESCTAGQFVTLLAAQTGSADVLEGGFVVYSKHAKTALLGVPRRLLRKCTPVSREVACAMARGALRRGGAKLALGITGVAGPTPDEDGNPVGLFFIAVARRGGGAVCEGHRLGSRNPSRILQAIHALALAMLVDAIGKTKREKSQRRR